MTFKFIDKIDEQFRKKEMGTSKNYIWDEIVYAEYVIKNGEPVNNHYFKDVFLLAKYYYHIENLDDQEIRIKLEKFIRLDEQLPIFRRMLKRRIEGAINGSKKQYMKVCNEIRITGNEINTINNMKDTTTRKIAFILLCMWKANSMKPFRTTIHQVANEIGINANGKKLQNTYYDLLREGYIGRYNRTAERRRRILEKMIEIDSQFGELFIPYDSIKYAKHVSSPTRRSSIAIWMYIRDYSEEPSFKFPSFYKNKTVEEIEEYKEFRYRVDGNNDLSLDYIKENIDFISRFYSREDFARIIDGEVFYHEEGAHDKVKVLFADEDSANGTLINVDELPEEYNKLFGTNRVVYGNCSECGCNIIRKSNKTKYCTDCKEKTRKEKVKENMRNMRKKKRDTTVIK